MTRENTPASNVGQEIPQEKRLDGVPANLLCRSKGLQAFMGVSNETWSLWVKAAESLGLTIDFRLGTKEGWGLTNDIHELFRLKPELAVRKSAIRKQRIAERKRKK